MTQKRVFVKTFGCQMNVYDSERMVAALASDGYQETDRAEDADLVLLNTCHIREKAAEKVYSDLGRLKSAKAMKPDLRIGVTGCVAQAEGAEIIKRQPMVDMVIGPQAYHRLPQILRDLKPSEAIVDTEFPAEDKFDHLPDDRKQMPLSAFLSVQEGCDKFCTFCVVPYTRGAERSRPVSKILAEAQHMVDLGVQEITLLGQNVNGYHGVNERGGETSLAALIEQLAQIDGLARIRFTTSHPMDMDEALINAFRDIPKLMPFLHLPIQSGSDRILKAMNRHHTRQSYLDIIERLRHVRPDIALSGDFIVGFPGETEEDFQRTMEIIDETGQAHGFSFKYSPRPGTPAAQMAQVDEAAKAERLDRLQARIETAQAAFLDNLIGKEIDVLWERDGKFEGQVSGRSPYLFPAISGLDENGNKRRIGTTERVTVTGAIRGSLLVS